MSYGIEEWYPIEIFRLIGVAAPPFEQDVLLQSAVIAQISSPYTLVKLQDQLAGYNDGS